MKCRQNDNRFMFANENVFSFHIYIVYRIIHKRETKLSSIKLKHSYSPLTTYYAMFEMFVHWKQWHQCVGQDIS